MIFDLHKIDVPIILSMILGKFSVGFITGMVIPIFPTLVATHFNESPIMESRFNATEFGPSNSTFNYQQLSILFATKNVGQIFFSPLMGYLCGALGSIKILLFGTVLQMLTALLYGLGNQYYFLILGRISESISNSALNCAVASFVAYHYNDNKKRGLVYGISGLGLCIGGAFGPAYGGLIFQYYGKLAVFLSVIPVIIGQTILIIWLLVSFMTEDQCRSGELIKSQIIEIEHSAIFPDITSTEESVEPGNNLKTIEPTNGASNIYNENHKVKESLLDTKPDKKFHTSTEVSIKKSNHNILHFFRDPYFMINVGSLPVIFISFFIYLATVPQYMRLKFGSTESQQGVVWMLNIVGYILGFFIGNFINSKFAKSRHIFLMGIIYVQSIGSICMALMPNWWSVAIPLCIIVNQQLIYEILLAPLLATIVEKRHHSKFGMMSGVIMTTLAIVAMIGSYLGPIMFREIGFLYLNVIILLLGLSYGPMLLFLKRFV